MEPRRSGEVVLVNAAVSVVATYNGVIRDAVVSGYNMLVGLRERELLIEQTHLMGSIAAAKSILVAAKAAADAGQAQAATTPATPNTTSLSSTAAASGSKNLGWENVNEPMPGRYNPTVPMEDRVFPSVWLHSVEIIEEEQQARI
jgi:hypothetical protein